MHIMDNSAIIQEVIQDVGLLPQQVDALISKYISSHNESISIPFVIPGDTFVYKPARQGFGGRIYVPDKMKMTKAIRVGLYNANPTFFQNREEFIFDYCQVYAKIFYPTPKCSKDDRVLSEMGYLRPDIKPDNDNVEKVYYDAIKEFIIYDDCSILDNFTFKYYSKYPRIEVMIVYWKVGTKRHERRIKSRQQSCHDRFGDNIYQQHKFMNQ